MFFCLFIAIILRNTFFMCYSGSGMAIDMFLKVEGATGESAESNHQGWIDVLAFTWGANQTGTMAGGGGGGAGKVEFSDLRISAKMDCATTALVKHCASGKHLGEVKVSVCKAGGSQIEYSTVVLKNVLVTNVSFHGTDYSEQTAVEYLFQSSSVEHHYWVQTAQGGKGAESQMGWDVKANRATA